MSVRTTFGNVIVRASDGSLWSEQVIAVTVTDVLGAPGAATANLLFTTAGNQTSAWRASPGTPGRCCNTAMSATASTSTAV